MGRARPQLAQRFIARLNPTAGIDGPRGAGPAGAVPPTSPRCTAPDGPSGRGGAGPLGRGGEGGHERRDPIADLAEPVPAREQARWVRRRRAGSHRGRPNTGKPEGDFG